ncbi:MAG: tyrosine-type recombinase/integrase [Bacteroidota bacterium]
MSIDGFVSYITFEKRFSHLTVQSYQHDLSQFALYCQSQYQINNIAEANHSIVRSWLVSLMELDKIKARSINRKISTLKSYYKFLLKEGVIKTSPMAKVTAPKTEKKLPVFVEQSKMNELFDETYFKTDYEGVLSKAIIMLFYATGMRRAELLNLKESSFNFYEGTVKVLGKRNKERLIPLTAEVIVVLKQYKEKKVTQKFISEYFFINPKAKPVSEQNIYTIVKKYLGNLGQTGKKSPHILRHTFATHMLNNGSDLNAIKEMLGHASLAATQVYTHNSIEKLKEAYKKAHPRGE